MTTLTDKELIKEIKERISSLDVRDNIERRSYEIALASLEAEPIAVSDDMAYAFHHALSDSSPGADEVEEIKAGLRAAFANVTAHPAPVVPDEIEPDDSNTFDYVDGWNACRAAMLHGAKPVSQTYKLNELSGNYPVTPDGWISCSERIPAQDDWVLIYSKHGEYMAGQVQGEYVELSDGTLSWLGNVLFWMPLPEPPQEVNRG